MSCLKNITRAVFLSLTIAIIFTIFGKDAILTGLNNFVNPDKEVILKRAQKVGDFSKIDSEFEIEKAAGVMGYNAVLAEHKASGQKMVVVESGKKQILTQDDIKADDAEDRILNAIKKVKYSADTLEDFHITQRGTMISYGQSVPFVRFSAKIKKIPIGDVSGIISVVKDDNGQDKILVSLNEKNKYSQLISNEFFKQIK